MIKRIIILASERSGTNLFRTLLNNHKHICGPVAPHFFDAFKSNLQKYGDLNKKENAELLLSHMIRLANHSYHDWKLKVTAKDLINNYNVNSFETAFDAMYLSKSAQEGKIHYVSKDNHLFNYHKHLENLDNIRYIYLYRDPRDHVASWLRTPLFMHTVFDIVNKWIKEQKIILEIANNHKVHFISYESLIENPENTMTDVLNFIELPIDEDCFKTNKNNIESKRNEFWKNLSKPIISTNAKKYKKTLSKRDIKIIESKAKDIMENLGYDFDTKANWKPFRGFGYELKYKRKLSKYRNKKFFNKKMKDLKDKLQLIKSFSKEL